MRNLLKPKLSAIRRLGMVLITSILLSASHDVAQAQSARAVHLELVLAIDISTSVDATEYILQRRGLANAFRHPEVIRAINSLGPLGIAVALVQWSANGRQRVAMDWQHVTGPQSAYQVSRKIDAAERAFEGMTDIGSAVRYSTDLLLTNQFVGERMVIDVSGDGTSYPSTDANARDDAIRQGITTNGLVIFSEEHDLGDLANVNLKKHYENYVVGGFGAFLMSANNFADYQTAIQKKLVREIIGPNYANLKEEKPTQFE